MNGINKNIPVDYEEKLNSAMQLRKEEKYSEAIKILELLSQRKPKLAATFAMLGATYWDIDDLKKAEVALREATRINAKSEKASVVLFHVLWGAGKHEEAMEEMKRFCSLQYSEEYNLILKGLNEALDQEEEI